MPLRCCQLVRKGRYVAAEPYFDGGPLISLANAKRHGGHVGHLAVVATTRNVGRVVEILGSPDDIHAVLRGLLADRGAFGEPPAPGLGLGDPPRDVQHQLDDLTGDLPGLDRREDLRAHLCVTIDPPGARDFDDAIGLELPGDDPAAPAVLWVHIADVAAYVPPGSALDLYALDRALSVYVPGTVAPMLPHLLSSDLCSLRPGLDRGCVSVRLEIDARGTVVGTRFARTVIRSARRLTYAEVDAVRDGERAIDPVVDDMLARLDALTTVLRERRMERGALNLQLPEVAFELGDSAPEWAGLELESPSHRMVEECMLLANLAVGQRLARGQLPGVWRVHDEPDPVAVEHLLERFFELGVPTPPMPDQCSPQQAALVATQAVELARRYAEQSGRGRSTFPTRVLRALKQAEYRSWPGRHSGLAVDDYVHFTSPIRRYPDLVNHRSLLAHIGADDAPPSAVDLDTVAEHVTFVERESTAVERRANDIVLAHLLWRRLYGDGNGEPADLPRVGAVPDDGVWHGEVTGLSAHGAFVRFDDTYEGFVPARTLDPSERFDLDDSGIALVGSRSGDRLQLGDPIRVVVHSINRARGRVELRRAPGPSPRGTPGPSPRGTRGRR